MWAGGGGMTPYGKTGGGSASTVPFTSAVLAESGDKAVIAKNVALYKRSGGAVHINPFDQTSHPTEHAAFLSVLKATSESGNLSLTGDNKLKLTLPARP